MAYDPEARQQSNSAMTIGIVALVLLVIGALAYFSTRGTTEVVATTPGAVHTERTIVETAPVNPPAPVVIDRTAPVVVTSPPTTKVIERNTTVTRDRVVTPPASAAPAGDTNVTVNVPQEPARTTAQPQAGSDSGMAAPGASGSDSGATPPSGSP